MLEIFPLPDIPIIRSKEQLWLVLLDKLKNFGKDGDILVVAHTPFSRVDGYQHKLSDITPSKKANELALELDKDPEKIEIILNASSDIVKIGRNIIITENKAGIICANAGVDESNAELGFVITVPDNPDKLASEIRTRIKDELNLNIAIIVSDTVGRALRKGAVNIGIGASGIDPMRSEIGKEDLFGYTMKVSEVAIIDEIAAAAELLQGQTDEGNPFIIVRGLKFSNNSDLSARDLNRPKNERLFQ